MTTHKDTASIIERLEAVSGPDRALDAMLHQILWPDLLDASPEKDGWLIGGEHSLPTLSARYTSSIDAALTLVPEGRAWLLGSNKMPGFPPCEMDIYEGRDFIIGNATAPTPALAIVLAALRARAHKREG